MATNQIWKENIWEPMGFEFASEKETKEFCGAARPSKELQKGRESLLPLIALRNFSFLDRLIVRGARGRTALIARPMKK